jgi:hypothetical protein
LPRKKKSWNFTCGMKKREQEQGVKEERRRAPFSLPITLPSQTASNDWLQSATLWLDKREVANLSFPTPQLFCLHPCDD